MNGILCMNKPAGFTSFDVIAKLRGILKLKRLGHAGTLDPMATGVLPVFVGSATKACDCLPNQEKSYRATFQFGVATDTQDCTGIILRQSDKRISLAALEAVLPQFRGDIMQVPPMYSAVSVGGRRLYDLARQGIEVERAPRPICVETLELCSFDVETQCGEVRIVCSKGTYIRTILHDIGETLGCGGMMTALVRESACGFVLAQCVDFATVEQLCAENRIEAALIPIADAFCTLPQLRLNAEQTRMYRNGVKLDWACVERSVEAPRYTVYGADGGFIGTAVPDMEAQLLRVEKNLTAGD